MDEKALIQTSLKSLQVENFTAPVELSITLVDDYEIRRLNRKYRAIDKTTDVLSFSQIEGEKFDIPCDAPVPLGDVVISVDTAARQAEDHGHSLSDEINLLLVHGILHLLGYDDQTNEAAEKMKQHEKKILGELQHRYE